MKKVHVIGICGKGMSALAIMLKKEDWSVTGSDAGFFDPVASYLKKHGQNFFTEYKEDNIPEDVDVIVIGKHAKLIPETNPEVAKAFELEKTGVSVVSFPEMLSIFLENTKNLVVVGSYGKSTCTALTAHILKESGREPSYFVGAFPKQFDTIAHLGKGPEFVLEGDEYPSSNWDNKSKFLWYKPGHILFTSGEHDHVNVFPTLSSYLKPYRELFGLLPQGGKIVTCVDSPHTVSTLPEGVDFVTYGITKTADYEVSNITYGTITSFTVKKQGKNLGEFNTTLLGKYNIQNILGVIAFLLETTDISLSELQKGVNSFLGVVGRLERTNSQDSTVPVYETYGSSYSKARTSINALKLHFPDKKIVVLFEPHTFGWRNPKMVHWYRDVFSGTSEVHILTPPTSHGKDTSVQLSSEDIVKEVSSGEKPPKILIAQQDKDQCYLDITTTDRSESIILLVTSGELQGLNKVIPDFFH